MPAHNPRLPAHMTDLSMPPPADFVIPVDTAGPSGTSNNQQSDIAGVLKRNQACLQCRKRKLKCDAVRPHCATCVRSYRHLLRTSPKSNPVLCCDYDDGTGAHADEGERVSSSKSPGQGPEEEEPGAKKKRKASGDGKRKKKDEEFEEERDRLTKKIEELQAQLTQNNQAQPAAPPSPQSGNQSNRIWSDISQSQQDPMFAASPTAFLEMLSSAASNQATNTVNVDISQATGSTTEGFMWGGNTLDQLMPEGGSAFKPLFMFDPNQASDQNVNLSHDLSPGVQSQESRKSSLPNPTSGGDSSSGVSNILSPGGVFNFSPGDTSGFSANWPNPPGPSGTLEPSTKVDGPWRAVETIETVFAASMNGQTMQDSTGDTNMESEINMDGLQAGLDAAVQQQLLMDLFWPGWPINLPEPNVVNDLIEAFFDLVPNLPRVLHRARFLSRMALPPTHSNFPHPALIHAVCAAAAAWCPPEIYEKSVRGKGWDSTDSTSGMGMYGTQALGSKQLKVTLSFGLRQASFAKDAVQEGLNTGNRLFDVVRAMIILCRVFIDDTRMLECWAYSGLVARMLLPLGLNVRSAELSLKSVMLPPPADTLEREERRAAVWMAFYHDTIASSASGWGTSMSLDELTVPLPVSRKTFDTGHERMEPNPQDLESPDFWVKHPVVDSFVLVIKASVLMNRVNKFVRRWKNRHMRDDDDFDGLNKPEFREIANAIACFQMSFPPALRNVGRLTPKRRFDIDLIAAHMLPHAAAICLHEPFADLNDPSDQAARRMLAATQAIVSIVQQLASVLGEGGHHFTSVMHSSVSVCLVTSARTSLLFLRQALNVGDMLAAQTHRTDCEMIRMALSQFGVRFKIGHHHSQLIEYFLDRATNPTYEKIQAHYPDHPRPGAPELTPTSNFGYCIANALNIKRGFWRLKGQLTPASDSPFGSTPDSRGAQASSSTSVSNHLSDVESPNHLNDGKKQSSYSGNTGTHTSSRRNTSGDPMNCLPTSSTNLPEYDFAGIAFPKGSIPRQQSNNASGSGGGTVNEYMEVSSPAIGTSSITPVSQEMADQITAARSIRPDGHIGVWLNTTEADLLAEVSKNQSQNPKNNSGTGIGLTSNFNNNGFKAPDISNASKEVWDKISKRDTVGSDGQLPGWINTTEAELIAERSSPSNNGINPPDPNKAADQNQNSGWDKISRRDMVGADGHFPAWMNTTESELAAEKSTDANTDKDKNSNSNTNTGMTFGNPPGSTDELEKRLSGFWKPDSNATIPFWSTSTEDQLMDINRNQS
ncbi:uncharacterized protein IL334_003988 [Kwoniella shivajii]|uniref:Zn(2)-C6 fungal-type domain-containing protein n=1 Tax=Kwoniella shivajii TaxID=564305 RepID=A0ABZ1D0C8_9TREE|nr:hypothetical protein IL334_003988 [Kwoniella shivajii]